MYCYICGEINQPKLEFMKKYQSLWLFLWVFIAITSHAQKTDCEFNIREALFYLKEDANFTKDSLKSVQLLKPCLEKGYDKAQLLMGRLHQAKKTEESYQKAFKLFKKAAQQENALAMADLGVLYKYGRGCKLNFNKARKWFQKSAELGNSKAAYSLGYLYFKGLGNIQQDYNKAVKWFQKSDYPMAKYWLGVCYLKGYGVAKDINKTNELLGEEFAENNIDKTSIDVIQNSIAKDIDTSLNIENDAERETKITQDFLLGNWKGTLLKLDWSKNHIESKKEIEVSFLLDSVTGTLKSMMHIDDNIIQDEIIKIENALYFENTEFILPHDSFKKSIPNRLTYSVISGDLKIKSVHNNDYLIANIESYIKNWNEAGMPLRLVLKKKETFNNRDKELSNDALIALSEQEDSFIKLYPNPFKNDLIISYSLTKQAIIEVQLSDLQGNVKVVVTDSKIQDKGDYRYHIDGSILKKGVYVVTVLLDGQRKTRVIIKK